MNEKISGYVTIQEASRILGVSPSTLRNWGRTGKIKTRRNPMNGYRLYKSEELFKLLRRIENEQGNN